MHPHLQKHLLDVVKKCTEIRDLRLYRVVPDATYTLDSFRQEQHSCLAEVKQTLDNQRETLAEFVERACKQEVQSTIASFSSDGVIATEMALLMSPRPAAKPKAPPGVVDPQGEQPRNVYTERAIVKGVCYRLTCCTSPPDFHRLSWNFLSHCVCVCLLCGQSSSCATTY